jgi:cellulose synthase/poly-beta-1,6-N-acetylglucosamine synthase-like glycosyltransferase
MTEILAVAAFWLGVLLCLPTGFVLVEVIAGLLRRQPTPLTVATPDTVVLIPAHDERVMLPRTLARLGGLVGPHERVLVVADNCTDDTAALARAAGVEVLERHDASARGKPFALAWAIDQLAAHPPEVVVILDADCWFTRGGPALLARAAIASGRPVQGIYRMEGASLRDFAFRFRGEIRLRGLAALGAPVQLCGSGFAVPWELLRRVPVPLGELTEDAIWGWRYCMAGLGVRLVPEVEVISVLPLSASGVGVQQHRWEYGVLSSTLRLLPQLLRSAFLPPRLPRILHLLDVLVPPLALTVLCTLAIAGLGVAAGGAPSALPAAAALTMLTLAVLLGWLAYARRELPAATLAKAPWYALRKFGLYLSFLKRRRKDWVRTDRDDS